MKGTRTFKTSTASVGSKDSPQMGKWLVDSGASSHMTLEKELLTDYMELINQRMLDWVMVGRLMQLESEMSVSICCLD